MSFFGHLLTGAASGYAKGAMDDLQYREAMASRLALLQQQQQDKMELQRQRAEDSRALREMIMAQGGRRGSGGGDGTNVFEVLMNADTPEKQQRAVAMLEAFGGSDGAALVADKVYGTPRTRAANPTAGDFARFDRGDPGADEVPQSTLERAAYDRDKGQQALQRLYALILDPGKTDDFAKAERQFGLNDMGTAVAARTLRDGGTLEDAAQSFSQYSSPKDETAKNDLASERIAATRERTAATVANADANRSSAETRKLQDLLARAKARKPNILDPQDAEKRAADIQDLEAQIAARSGVPAKTGAPYKSPSDAAKAFKYTYKPR